jgi:2,4-dienoyl-CoA reductase (NADPH2)
VYDERPLFGGQLAVAAAAPNRRGWQAIIDFYERALRAAPSVELQLGVHASAATLEDFEEVVIACGSEEVLPPLPGISRAVSSSEAIRAGAGAIAKGSTLLIADDGFGSWACASAVELGIEAGAARILVVTPGAAFGAALPAEGRAQLLARLRGAPLEVRPLTTLEELTGGGAEVRNTISDERTTFSADTVIVVGERRAREWTYAVPAVATVRVIGDAVVPRRVAHAISEGRAAAEAIATARANIREPVELRA